MKKAELLARIVLLEQHVALLQALIKSRAIPAPPPFYFRHPMTPDVFPPTKITCGTAVSFTP